MVLYTDRLLADRKFFAGRPVIVQPLMIGRNPSMALMYILSGIALVAAFIIVIVYYYSPKRKDDIEAAKYEMLRDDAPDYPDSDEK